MSNIEVFDFSAKKILAHASKLSDQERIKYLKHVIVEYKVQSGIFETQLGVGLRMPAKLSKSDIVVKLEEEIENSKKHIFVSDNQYEKVNLHFEDALSMIDDVLDTLKDDPDRASEYLIKLQKRIQIIVNAME